MFADGGAEGKLANLMSTSLLDGFTIFVAAPDDLVYDERNPHCCVYKCPNYGTRCFCPPYSLPYKERALSKKYVLIFARTIQYGKSLRTKVAATRAYITFEREFKEQVLKIFKWWGLNNKDVFSTGFPLDECDQCFQNSKRAEQGPKSECFPMPSAEAFYVDIQQTMHNLGYNTNFQMNLGATRIAMIFTDEPSCNNFIGRRIDCGDQPFPVENISQCTIEEIKEKITKEFPDLKFDIGACSAKLDEFKEKYHFLRLWDHVLFWKLPGNAAKVGKLGKKMIEKRRKKVRMRLHQIVFNCGYYYALDFLASEVTRQDSEFVNWFGLEIF